MSYGDITLLDFTQPFILNMICKPNLAYILKGLHGLALTVFLSPGLVLKPVDCQAQLMYAKSSINLPASISALKSDWDLDGDGLNDVIVTYQRRIMVFFQANDGRFSSAPDIEIGGETPVPQKYAAVSVGKVSTVTGNQLLFLGSDGIDYLNFSFLRNGANDSVEPRNLVLAELPLSSGPELTFLNCATDLDGDGKPEIVLPAEAGYKVYSSSDGGSYLETAQIKLPSHVRQHTSLDREPRLLGSAFFSQGDSYGAVNTIPDRKLWNSVRFSTTRYTDPLLFLDYNMDQKIDILSQDGVLIQHSIDDFQRTNSAVYQKLMSAIVPHESRNVLVTVPSVADLNRDQLLDTYSVNVTTAKLSPRTDVSIFLGDKNRNYGSRPTQVLKTRDFAYSDSLPLGDVNGDGCLDVALFHLDFQPSSMQSQLKAYLRNGLDGDLRFYLWDKEKQRYPDSPSFKHPIRVSYEIYGARQFFRQQVSISQDMTGDGKSDLVIKTGATEFSVFENQGSTGFSRKASAVVSTAPTRFSSLSTADINQDGVGDVVVSGYLEEQEDRIIYSFYTSPKNTASHQP